MGDAIDVSDSEADRQGELISLREAARSLPRRRRGKRPSVSCLHRWAGEGLHGVRLRVTAVGGTRCTTEAWLREFFDQVEAARSAARSGPPSPRVVRNVAAVEAALQAEGF